MHYAVQEVGDAEVGSIELADAVFGAPFNESLVHQVVTAYMSAARAGTRKQKTRAEVSGGGSKPWRQKGTGRARAGSSRGPIWRGGGVTFAARPADHSQKVNKKMYRGAMRCILSELVRQERLVLVEGLTLPEAKTKALVSHLSALGLTDVLLVIESHHDEVIALAGRNLHWCGMLSSDQVDPVSLLAFHKVLMTIPALKQLEGRVT